jgi:hypothetical protein
MRQAKKQAGSNPGNQTVATRTKGMKRKAVEPEAPIVTGTHGPEKPPATQMGMCITLWGPVNAEVVRVEVVADEALSVYPMQMFCKNCSEISHR